MSPTDAVVWIFLGIFLLTALITLGALIGWIRLQPYYMKKLFHVLLLQIVATVIGYAAQQMNTPGPPDLRATLLSDGMGWDSQYAEKGWRSRLRFENVEGGIRMLGYTYVPASARNPILTWESLGTFEIPKHATTTTFRAVRTWTDTAAKLDPSLIYEVGKKTEVDFTITLIPAFRGAIKNVNSAETWGVMMTPAFH